MFKYIFVRKKGIAILLVLLVILIIVLLANIILVLISSHYRFTQHQVTRIQAYYAGWAGVNYAMEKIRDGNYTVGVSCLPPGGCSLTDLDFPNTVTYVGIYIIPVGGVGCEFSPGGSQACLKVRTSYRSN